MPHENEITLNGQTLITMGPVASRSIAEFQAGFKIGKATYDDREHAFFLPLDDFSGGIGSRVIDIHEALGAYWDSVEGLDARVAGHLVLPPLKVSHSMASSPNQVGFTGDRRCMLTTNINSSTDAIIVAAGDKIWRSTDGATFAEVATLRGGVGVRDANNVNSLFDFLSTPTGQPIVTLTESGTTATATTNAAHGLTTGDSVIISGATDTKYNGTFTVTVTGATTFTYTTTAGATSPDTGTSITYTAPPTRRLYAFTIGADLTSRYWTSKDGVTWTEQSRTVYEGVAWDNKIVASLPLPAGSPYGPQGQTVCGYTTDGLAWNVDQVANDADLIDGSARPIFYFQSLPHWVGVAMGPSGIPWPYFIDNGFLYALDFYNQTAVKIEEVGDKARIVSGGVFEGYIYVTDGYNIWIYDPGNSQTVRRIGIFNRFGPPPSFNVYTVSTFLGGTSTLYVCLGDNANNFYRLLAYSGVGWIPIGPKQAGVPIGVAVNRLPVGNSVNLPSRYVDVLVDSAQLGTTISIDRYQLPTIGDIPIYGDVPFDAGPDSLITGWYDGGFIDIRGALHRMYIYAFNVTSTETVKVEYQLDNAENSAWTTLGTFTDNTGTIWFDATNHRGIEFRTVRFRITMARGATTTATPELVALVMVYDKKPEFRSAWTLRIDVDAMVIEEVNVTNALTSLTEVTTTVTATTEYPHGLKAGDSVTIAGAADSKYNGTFTVVAAPTTTTFTYTATAGATSPDTSTTATWTAKASLGRVWSFLKHTFNIKTLLPLVIPNVEDAWAPGLNVRIVDMPATFDDYRNAVLGKGFIELSLIQPVGLIT